MTFSIVGHGTDARGEAAWGVAVASKFLAVGNVVPAAVAGVGALATQADANVAWKGIGLSLLDEGATAGVALQRMIEEDDKRDHRQLGIVDVEGGAASHTGPACLDWAGGVSAPGVAIQGNVLAGPEVVDAMKRAWDETADSPLARRLLAALAAGDAAGGDRRGRQSAALLVVSDGAGYAGLDDVAADLRVDDHPEPVTELARLLDLNDFYLTASTDAEKVPVTPELAAELEELARAAGHPDLQAWAGTENYEMRVAEDGSWIDQKVLDLLRESGGDR
ncbi:putative Ntn-hydrolase superfamily protein [Marmoricola sp. URHA0025 HA25]